MIFELIAAVFLSTTQIAIGDKTLEVEIADTEQARTCGLMNRETLEEGKGMLFIFDRPAPLSFWMKNTTIPLSIGYFDENRKLLNTADMKPSTKGQVDFPVYPSAGPARYALEVPQGWFNKNNIEKGMKFSFLDQD